MRFSILLCLTFFILGCADSVQHQDLENINGYWEIQKVVFPDGSSKEYSISTTIDYFEYAELTGFRKKVQPKLDGTFNTSDDAEFFKIVPKNNTFIIQYANDLSSWEETIKVLTKSTFVVVNNENLVYHYKRYESPLHQ